MAERVGGEQGMVEGEFVFSVVLVRVVCGCVIYGLGGCIWYGVDGSGSVSLEFCGVR